MIFNSSEPTLLSYPDQTPLPRKSDPELLLQKAEEERQRILKAAEEERLAILTRTQEAATAEWNALLVEANAEIEQQKKEILELTRTECERYREEQTSLILRQAETQANAILQQAQEQKNQLLARAQSAADFLLENARRDAENKLEAAQNTASHLLSSAAEESLRQSKQRGCAAYLGRQTDQELLTSELRAVTQTLTHLHANVRAIESAVTEAQTRRVYAQLSDLYFLMCDNRRSLSERSDAGANPDIQATCRNLDMFMSIVSEILADHGIRTIHTEEGAPFDGKYHRPHNTTAFDPAEATVGQSLRCGFEWNGSVLEKEWINITTNREGF